MRRFNYYRKLSLLAGRAAAATRHLPPIVPSVSHNSCDGCATANARHLSTLVAKIRSSLSPFITFGVVSNLPEDLTNYPPSETPLRCLEKLFLRDLTLQGPLSRKTGRYLLLRTASLATPATAGDCNVLVGDGEPEGLRMWMLLQNIKPKDIPLRDFLPQGTVFVVKEPVVIPIPDGDTGYFGLLTRYVVGLRVDHINDIIFSGNDAFNEVIKMPEGWRPQSSGGVVMRKMVPQPKWKNQQRAKKARIQQRAREEQGVFDFQAMREATKKDPLAELDHASYISNSIEIKSTSQMGRGLFAVKDIQAGELLLCERAFRVVRGDGQGDESHMSHMNRLLRDCVHQLNENPKLGEELLQLASRGNFGNSFYQKPPRNSIHMVDGKPVIDSFQVNQVLAVNAYACPILSAEDLFAGAGQDPGLGVWLIGSLFNHSCYPNAIHSFLSNMMLVRAARDIAGGDQVFLQYNNGPNKNYQNTYEERQVGFQRSWGFNCQCQVCEFEASEDPRKRAKRTELDRGTLMPLLNELPNLPVNPPKEALHKLLTATELLLKELEIAYIGSPPPHLYPRHILAGAHLLKYQIYGILPDHEGMFLSSLDVFDALGYSLEVSANKDNITIKRHGFAISPMFLVVAYNAWFMNREASSGKVSWGIAQGWKDIARHFHKLDAGETASFDSLITALHRNFQRRPPR